MCFCTCVKDMYFDCSLLDLLASDVLFRTQQMLHFTFAFNVTRGTLQHIVTHRQFRTKSIAAYEATSFMLPHQPFTDTRHISQWLTSLEWIKMDISINTCGLLLTIVQLGSTPNITSAFTYVCTHFGPVSVC